MLSIAIGETRKSYPLIGMTESAVKASFKQGIPASLLYICLIFDSVNISCVIILTLSGLLQSRKLSMVLCHWKTTLITFAIYLGCVIVRIIVITYMYIQSRFKDKRRV